MSVNVKRNKMGLMVEASEQLADASAPSKCVRTTFVPNGFETQLAGFSALNPLQSMQLTYLEYIDGVTREITYKHVHIFRPSGGLIVIASLGIAIMYGHGFRAVQHQHEFKLTWTRECVILMKAVEIKACAGLTRCSGMNQFVNHTLVNLRRLLVFETPPTDDMFKSNAVEENTIAFLNPQPNSAIEIDYAFREWKWVLSSKEYLNACVKRNAENGLHFLSMALSAHDLNESVDL